MGLPGNFLIWQSKAGRFKMKNPDSPFFLKTRRPGYTGVISPAAMSSGVPDGERTTFTLLCPAFSTQPTSLAP